MPNRAEITEEIVKTLQFQRDNSKVDADEILAATVEPSSIDAYIATERRESEKEIRAANLSVLIRYRDEVKANLQMRKEWVIQSEAQLEAVDEMIDRLNAGTEGGF